MGKQIPPEKKKQELLAQSVELGNEVHAVTTPEDVLDRVSKPASAE